MSEIKTVYDLKYEYYKKHPSGHYFDRDTLKFFGETLSNMYLWKGTHKVKDISGEVHECYILRKTGRRPWGETVTDYAYFDVETLDDIIT